MKEIINTLINEMVAKRKYTNLLVSIQNILDNYDPDVYVSPTDIKEILMNEIKRIEKYEINK